MDVQFHPRQKVFTVFDGRRCVLKARQQLRFGWIVKTYGWCIPEANKPNAFGITDASLSTWRHKRDVQKLVTYLENL
jgi:hypothetical protein